MNREEFETIFKSEDTDWTGDNAFKGLQIIAKYINVEHNDILEGAGHDIIYSADVDDLIENGITKEDTIALKKLNWMIDSDGDCLACSV